MVTPILPDSPISTLEADLLGRGQFAQSLADLIIHAPGRSSLKIGVFGGWGEGKTSVLQLVRQILEREGHVCAWLVPWVTEKREEIAQQLTLQIAEKLRVDLSRLKTAKQVQVLADRARKLTRDYTRLRVFEALVGPAIQHIIGKWINRQGEALAQAISEALGSKKLIVFVDDVDRVKPELVPSLLLTLREALDQPDFFYVMALDPRVVEEGLKDVHEAWGSPGDFLEKIIEIPRYLPEPSSDALQGYAKALVASVESMDSAPVLDILSLLPRNPRRLKLFIRYTATLLPLTGRMFDWELDLRAFYILQLLQLEFPNQIRAALKDVKFVDEIQYGGVRGAIVPKATNGTEDRQRPSELELKHIGSHPYAERFVELCRALRQRGFSTWAYYGLAEAFSMPENPPLFTYRECLAVADLWASKRREDAENDLLARVSVSGNLDAARCRAFWQLLMNIRDMRMATIVEEDLEDKIREGLASLSALTSLASFLVVDRDGFHNRLLTLAEWRALYKVTAKWAHFRIPGYYQKARQEERDLLSAAFNQLSDEDKAALHANFAGSLGGEEPNQAPEFRELIQVFAVEANQATVSIVLARFGEDGGLEHTWAVEMESPIKSVLFRHDSILYTDPGYRRSFLDLALGAKENVTYQLNFLTFFRQLAFGATHLSSFPMEECRKILGDGDVISAVWSAVVSRPLNPRLVGSLRQHRLMLVDSGFVSQEQTPIPEGWKRLEDVGFWA